VEVGASAPFGEISRLVVLKEFGDVDD
jgi:hypothetical protein